MKLYCLWNPIFVVRSTICSGVEGLLVVVSCIFIGVTMDTTKHRLNTVKQVNVGGVTPCAGRNDLMFEFFIEI